MLVGVVYLSQLVDGIRDMLRKPELTEDLVWTYISTISKQIIGVLTAISEILLYKSWVKSLESH